jgi:uncharacterized membrane protein YgcG
MKKIIFVFAAILLFPLNLLAKNPENITDWYIKDMQTTITVQSDSSLLIEERISADAGNLPDKHGIFRVVPVETKTGKRTIKTPVSLVSITDFGGNAIPYSASTNNFDHTITWKIGSADKTVAGVNDYKITYLVKNAVRSDDANFDELYWNLNGNFWDIETDNFSASIIFPAEITKDNSRVYLYSGNLGQKDNGLASYEWTDDNTLNIASKKTLLPGQGITASITFPKNIVKPYQPGFFELYGDYLWFILPLLIFFISWRTWLKYGKDPVVGKTVIPEFEIPENLPPMEMGLLANNGSFNDSLISATIIDLAVKKHIIIEEIPKSGIFGKQDFRLKKTGANATPLGEPEKILIDKIFGADQEILLSKLKDNFYKDLPAIKKSGIEALKNKKLIYQSGLTMKTVFIAAGSIALFGMIFALTIGNIWLILSLALAGIILLVFGLLMPKRTHKGAELNWRIKGFKLYMGTAEKYRAQFNEKENIFEKFLPYAIMFGMAKLWIKKMEQIYGKEYFANYHPAWYAGAFSGNFDADSFTSQINSISAGIASNIGSSSGAGGAGGAGGGGGGGGGGGW